MENEVWKDVINFEGFYQVSDLGNVRSVVRKVNHFRGGCAVRKSVLLSKEFCFGYFRVMLRKGAISKRCYVHRLVAEAFIPKIDLKDFVNHKDHNRSNNLLENLEWVSKRENSTHAFLNRELPTGIYKTKNGKYIARISIKKKRINLGTYDFIDNALSAYNTALKNLNITNKYTKTCH